jgi:hypothetical protein
MPASLERLGTVVRTKMVDDESNMLVRPGARVLCSHRNGLSDLDSISRIEQHYNPVSDPAICNHEVRHQ